jgi:hypothetical protein
MMPVLAARGAELVLIRFAADRLTVYLGAQLSQMTIPRIWCS